MGIYKRYLNCKKCNKRYGTDFSERYEDGFCPLCSPKVKKYQSKKYIRYSRVNTQV
jgi:rubrerythrin